MSNACNQQIINCIPGNACACVKYNPVTGQLAVDGELVKLYTQAASVISAETIGGTFLNPAVAIAASSINGLCAQVAVCMSSLPVGSIDIGALKPGAAGSVLQTVNGKAAWAPLDDGAIQKAFADNPVPLPPIDQTELKKVYGENAASELVAVTPQGSYESAVAGMSQSSAAAPLKQLTGVDAGGMAVRSRIIQNGAQTIGEAAVVAAQTLAPGTSMPIASVIAPTDGLYAVTIETRVDRFIASPAIPDTIINTVFLVIDPLGLAYHTGSDYTFQTIPAALYPVGALAGVIVRFGQVATRYYKAGDKVELTFYNDSNTQIIRAVPTGAHRVVLTSLGAVQIATP